MKQGARLIRFLALARVVAIKTWRGFITNRGFDLASGLAYTSLLSFVPLVVSVTVLASTLFGDPGTGLFRFINNLMPGASRDFMRDLEAATRSARSLSGWLTFLFILASLRMFLLVESAVNELWGTAKKRSLLIWTGIALNVVLFGPICIGVTVSLLIESGLPITEFRFSGFIATAALLTLFYKLVPAANVRWGPAAAAGTTAALGIGLIKIALARSVHALANISRIYGSISAVAVFILAIGFVWDILLLCVSLAHALQFREELLEHYEPEKEARRSAPLDDAVRLMLRLGRAFRHGNIAVGLDVLADEIRRSDEETEMRLLRLASADLVEVTETGYRLARSPDRISLYAIARAIGESAPRPVPPGYAARLF